MDHSNISRWCAFFKDGRENLCDSPCTGQPVKAATPWNVTAIEAGIFIDRQFQLQTLSQQFNIAYGAVYNILYDTLKFCKAWATHQVN